MYQFKEIYLLKLRSIYELTINCSMQLSMHVFMMTKLLNGIYLQRQFENVDQLKLALEAEWNRLSRTFY